MRGPLDMTREQVEWLAAQPVETQRRIIGRMTAIDALSLDVHFETWRHESQLPPSGEGWRVWLMLGGRGLGKTRAGAEWILRLATQRKRPVLIALVGATEDEVRKVMVEGPSGLLAVAAHYRIKVKWEPSLKRLTWRSGSVAEIFSGENPDGLRGPQHHYAWCDELAKWARPEETWDNLQMSLRAGERPRALVTTTPRPIPLVKRIAAGRWTVVTRGRTSDSLVLSDAVIDMLVASYGRTSFGRQELDGELIEEVEGSLWPPALIERCRDCLPMPDIRRGTAAGGGGVEGAQTGGSRVNLGGPCQPALHHGPDGDEQVSTAPSSRQPCRGHGEPAHPRDLRSQGGREYRRIVIGVDPPASAAGTCGIVACGIDADGIARVLGDHSAAGLSPEGWARRVVAAAEAWGAERVVAEANQGGEMVASVLRSVDPALPVKCVHARYGKVSRAEPVAMQFEIGRARFAGMFPELEDELSGMTTGGGYQGPGRSPDRADAMVWAMTELLLGKPRAEPRIRVL